MPFIIEIKYHMAPKGRKSASKANKSKAVSGSTKAGTLFPVGRLNRYIKQGRYSERVGASAGAFLAAVLEYLTAEILEMSADLANQHGRKTIAPKHLNLAIRSDEEMQKMINNTTIHEGGMVAHINEFLLP